MSKPKRAATQMLTARSPCSNTHGSASACPSRVSPALRCGAHGARMLVFAPTQGRRSYGRSEGSPNLRLTPEDTHVNIRRTRKQRCCPNNLQAPLMAIGAGAHRARQRAMSRRKVTASGALPAAGFYAQHDEAAAAGVAIKGDTKVVSTATWTPPQSDKPFAMTSMRRSSSH